MRRTGFVFPLHYIISALLMLWFSNSIFAQRQGLTPEQLVSLKSVIQSAVSPDGKRIAYVVRIPRKLDEKPGSSYYEIWLTDLKGTFHRQYTAKPVSAYAVQWSPDGKYLSFLSRQTEFDSHTQVYIVPVDGGVARPLTRHETSVRFYRWSPDGKWIAFVATDPVPKVQKQAEKTGKDWIIYDENYRTHRLWLFDVEHQETHMLLRDDLSVWDLTWSPDSKTIVFQGSETPLTDDSYMFKKIYRISIEEGIADILCQTEGKLGHMAFSPDGTQLAFLGATSLNDPLAQSLFVVPASGGSPRNLTENFQGSAHSLVWLDNRSILLLSTEGVQNTLRKIDTRDGDSRLIYRNGPVITSISLHRKSGNFAAVASAPEHPSELFSGRVKKRNLQRLTDSNPELKTVQLARQEVIEWEGAAGWKIQGILTYPLHYRTGRRYPLALQIHGGPEGVSLNNWRSRATYPVQVLAANDYFVLEPNYRGSGGRGVAFSKADHDDLGGKEFQDVLAGVDYLIRQGMVNKEQVVTGGWSYGGYFSAWAATRYSERFKAAVVCAGLTNWISFAGTTDIPHEMSLVHWNSYWYQQRDLHWERSPLYYITNAHTPTLIVHGLNDHRVHPEQSLELYQALKLNKVPAKLVMYPREPHGLRETPHSLHYIRTVLEWFEKYVKKTAQPAANKYGY